MKQFRILDVRLKTRVRLGSEAFAWQFSVRHVSYSQNSLKGCYIGVISGGIMGY